MEQTKPKVTKEILDVIHKENKRAKDFAESLGKELTTDYWVDLRIGEYYGYEMHKKALINAVDQCKNDIKLLAELYLILMWLSDFHYGIAEDTKDYKEECVEKGLARLYNSVAGAIYDEVYKDDSSYSKDDISYFFDFTD